MIKTVGLEKEIIFQVAEKEYLFLNFKPMILTFLLVFI